jgi:hypothetical protein
MDHDGMWLFVSLSEFEKFRVSDYERPLMRFNCPIFIWLIEFYKWSFTIICLFFKKFEQIIVDDHSLSSIKSYFHRVMIVYIYILYRLT